LQHGAAVLNIAINEEAFLVALVVDARGRLGSHDPMNQHDPRENRAAKKGGVDRSGS
jgi:hypothetical protein